MLDGTIKTIAVNKAENQNVMGNTQVSLPKPPDDSEYINSLEGNDKRMFDLFQEVEESRDEAKLIELVKSGQIGPTDTNKEGQTALMLAIDSSFSAKTVEALIELGSDVNACDEDGMTALHKSYWVENGDIFKLLLERGADPDLKDNDNDTGRNLAEGKKKFKIIFEEVMGDNIAVSLTKSEFE